MQDSHLWNLPGVSVSCSEAACQLLHCKEGEAYPYNTHALELGEVVFYGRYRRPFRRLCIIPVSPRYICPCNGVWEISEGVCLAHHCDIEPDCIWDPILDFLLCTASGQSTAAFQECVHLGKLDLHVIRKELSFFS